MNRMSAIVEREMRKFFRSPTLMVMSLMMPILQLIIMGNAFGGKIVGAKVAVVDYDHGPEAVKIREGFDLVKGMRQKRQESLFLRRVPAVPHQRARGKTHALGAREPVIDGEYVSFG